jgi:hypothetical protein
VNNKITNQGRKIFKPLATDSWAELVYKSGQHEKVEFYFGAGYLSQSSRAITIPENVEKLIIHGFDGKTRNLDQNSIQQ